MNTRIHKLLVASMATGALSFVLATGCARAADLEVSGTGAGESYTVSGTENFQQIRVGIDNGETGTLTIGAGATLNTSFPYGVGGVIGMHEGSTGTVNIQGAGALWDDIGADSSIYVGDQGTGAVNLSGGASWQSHYVYLGAGATGDGTVTVGGAGTLWQNTGNIEIGYVGTGDVTVSNGARVETAQTYIGRIDGQLIVEGEGTTWFSKDGGQIARDNGATGTLIIRDGGTFETYDQGIYTGAGSSITVTGAGSQLLVGTEHPELPTTWSDSDGWLALDGGSLTISNGGVVHTDGSHFSSSTGSSVAVTVTGQGSKLINDLSFYIGGTGGLEGGYTEMTISDGAWVTAYTGAVGTDITGEAILTITGEGSKLQIDGNPYFSGNMRVGYEGDGTVIVQNGGLLKNANVLDIASAGSSTSILAIGALAGDAPVAPGTVEAGNGIFFGEGDATLLFNHTGTDYTFANVLSSTIEPSIRHQIVNLAGVTNLTADSPDYSGAIEVQGGTLKANGNLSGASVTVHDGGTLGGAGTISSLVAQSGGTVAPGNSPGTLTVVNSALFQSGSTFDVEIGGLLHDSVFVQNGDATIEDNALLNVTISPNAVLNNPYEIILLDGGSAGQVIATNGFTLQNDYPLLVGALDYNAKSVTLTYQALASAWSGQVSTPNQGAAADAVQALGGGNAVYDAALFVNSGDLDTAFDLLSGEIHASLKTVLLDGSQSLRDATMGRLTDIKKNDGVWATGFGNWGSVDGDGNTATTDHDTAGLFIGADRRAGNWQFGVLGGYSNTNVSVDDRASSAGSENYHLGLYAGGNVDNVRLRGAMSHSWHNLSTARMVTLPASDTLTADYNAGTTQVFGEVGLGLGTEGADIEPFAGLAYVNLHTGDYAETGGDAALTGQSANADMTFTTLGMRGAFNVGGATLKSMLGWRHAFGDVAPGASHAFGAAATPFTVTGVPVERDAALADVTLNMPLGDNVNFHLGYRGEFGADTIVQGAQGGLNINF